MIALAAPIHNIVNFCPIGSELIGGMGIVSQAE